MLERAKISKGSSHYIGLNAVGPRMLQRKLTEHDPSIVFLDRKLTHPVTAEVPQFNGAGLYGSSNYLVIEADEYQNKLQYFNPKMILLNNIDYDHPDFFKDEESYEKVFADFIGKLPKSGILVANFENKTILKISQTCRARVASYGFSKKCDYQISETSWDGQRQYFNLKLKQDDGLAEIGNFSIQLNGEHNILNATAVIVACIELGADLNLLRRALDAFTGTARRLQILGSYQGALIVDDYAHHPTEIKASLAAAIHVLESISA
jgi:UDP-N-acetylmuramate--alanine ligase